MIRAYIALVSPLADINSAFVNAGESLIPKEIRRKLAEGCIYVLDAFDPMRLGKGITVEEHILRRCSGCDYAVALIDGGLNVACRNIRHGVLSAEIETISARGGGFHNFFSSRLAKVLKAAIFTRDKMAAVQIEQAMRLPIRNFESVELRELCRVYREDILQTSFHNDVKRLIFELGNRRHPRRRSNFPNKYFVDDKERYFGFGREVHELLPTGVPHEPRCELNGRFRFGRKISIDQHFNVSQGDGDRTYIAGEFLNCHDAVVIPTRDRTHLNMFSNDHC